MTRRAPVELGRRHAMRVLAGSALWLAAGCDTDAPSVQAEQEPLAGLKPDGTVPKVLHFGVSPAAGAHTAEQLKPLLDYLSNKLEIAVKGVTAPGYDKLAELLRRREVVVGQFSPLAYVNARATLPGIMVATATDNGSPTYVSYLVVRRVQPAVPELAELQGKKIAWVHRSSSSGYSYPRALLCFRGFDPDSFFAKPAVIAGNHTAAIAALRRGEVDVAAVASNFVDQAGNGGPIGEVDDLVVVAKSERIPLDCVVLHNSVQRAFGQKLRKALLSVADQKALAEELSRKWGVNGFVAAKEGLYKRVKMVKDMTFDHCADNKR